MCVCGHCRSEIDGHFRFCPWCGAAQRVKLVEWFRPHPVVERGRALGLRVSRYLDGTPHVRLSIWRDDRAEAAVSLAEDEAERLARFLAPPPRPPSVSRLSGLRRRERSLR